MEKSFSAVLPDHGKIRFWRELDDGGWWYNIAPTDTQGISFTIAREHETAERFAEQLADFLSWPLEDQVGRGKKIQLQGTGADCFVVAMKFP